MKNDVAIQFDLVTKVFGNLTVLDDVSFEVLRGQAFCILGRSGAGKSVTLRQMIGLMQPDSGSIFVQGENVGTLNSEGLTRIRKQVGFLFQYSALFDSISVEENVAFGLNPKRYSRSDRERQVSYFIKLAGLSGFEKYYPAQLSGGMGKRASIIRALAYEPPVILMDEPFGPLDAQTRLVLQDELVRLWQGTGRTIVFVTHDIVEAITLSDRIATFTGVPGSIKQVRDVTLPRPRDVFHIHETPGFATIYDAIWNDLREELLEERGRDAGA